MQSNDFLGLFEKIEQNKVMPSNLADFFQHTFQFKKINIMFFNQLLLLLYKKVHFLKISVDWILGLIPQTEEVGSYSLSQLTRQTKLSPSKPMIGVLIGAQSCDLLKANVSQENRILCHVLRHFSIVLPQNTVHLKQNI